MRFLPLALTAALVAPYALAEAPKYIRKQRHDAVLMEYPGPERNQTQVLAIRHGESAPCGWGIINFDNMENSFFGVKKDRVYWGQDAYTHLYFSKDDVICGPKPAPLSPVRLADN